MFSDAIAFLLVAGAVIFYFDMKMKEISLVMRGKKKLQSL